MTPDPSPQLLGGRYQVGTRIGGGRMTEVFQGVDTVTNRPVAIKILGEDFVEDPAFAARFVEEAALFVQEQQTEDTKAHSNLVKILDSGIDGTTYWVAMELVSGATLAFIERENPGPMEPGRAVDIAVGVCNALSFAHSHGVIHRDVTAHNILIGKEEDGSEVVKLMDTGIARPTSATTAAQTAATLGSATYISPEIARGGEPFARSDLYSLGVVLYEMLTGRAPFTGESPVAIAMSHVRETPKKPTEVVPTLSPQLGTIVMKALAKNPADRYASADELRVDLEAARPSGSDAPAAETDSDEPAKPPVSPTAEADTMMFTSPAAHKEGRAVNVRLLAGVVLAVAVVLLGAFLLLTRQNVVIMPNVIGQPSVTAQSALTQAGLKVGIIERTSETDAPGIVLDQAPAAGQEVPSDETVTLTVAVAVQPSTVPSYIGQQRADVEFAINTGDFTLGAVSQTDSTEPPGTVVGQDPAPGTIAEPGTPINLQVSAGSGAPEGVANLTCQGINQAGNALQDQGLQMQIAGQEVNDLCPPGNRIARQDPLPGSDAPQNGIVQVWTTEAPVTSSTTPQPFSPAPTSPSPSPSP